MTPEARYEIDVENCLLLAICESPEEFDRYRVLADYHEECGDLLAADCWRWLAEKKRRPSTRPQGTYTRSDVTCAWWWLSNTNRNRENDVPYTLIEHMIDDVGDRFGEPKCFLTIRNAFLAAVAGWRKLSDGEREECWRWQP